MSESQLSNRYSGALGKMTVQLTEPVSYSLELGEVSIELNKLLGKKITIEYAGQINCCYCGRLTRKSFNQGFCYPCFQKLARCDRCIMSPDQCHYHLNTCREPEWGEVHCMTDHVVYLANTSSLKVGITRASQIPIRWIDQGAVAAVPVYRAASRYLSGLLEKTISESMSDRTNWRAMLKGDTREIDLVAERDNLLARYKGLVTELRAEHGQFAVQEAANIEETQIHYPVQTYPTKISSLSLDKEGVIGGTLMGIKGQYLIFDSGVVNIRKFGAYQVNFSYE